MGEIITLTDDIDGSTVMADERVRFSVDRREYEIDLTAEHAAELRKMFDVFTTTVRVRASIDGVEYDTHLPSVIAEDFNDAITYWTEHARTKGSQAPRVGAPAKSRPSGPAIQPGKRFWVTPTGMGHGTIAARPWREIRDEIKQWAESEQHPLSETGPIPDNIGYAFALMRQGKPWSLDSEDGHPTEAADEIEAALMPEPERTTTTTTTSRAKGKRK